MYTPTTLMIELAQSVKDEVKLKDNESKLVNEVYNDYLDTSKYEKITITYLGEPKAQARLRKGGNFLYDPSKSIKVEVATQIVNQLGTDFQPLSKALFVKARYYKAYPKSATRKNRVLMELGVIRPTGRPDIDNYDKLIYDAMLNVLYTDDSIIVSSDTQKFYSCKPRVEIDVYYLKEGSS